MGQVRLAAAKGSAETPALNVSGAEALLAVRDGDADAVSALLGLALLCLQAGDGGRSRRSL